MDNVTPDGYTVDASGAWTVNGIVQIQEQPTVVMDTKDTLMGTYVAYNLITGRTATIKIPLEGPLYYEEIGNDYYFSYEFEYGIDNNQVQIYDPGMAIYYDVLNIEPDGNLSYIDVAEEGAFTVWFMKQ